MQSIPTQQTRPTTMQYSNAQAPWRLVILSVMTFALYEIYWFYRNWKHLKIHKNLDISPGWRTVGLFIPIVNIVFIYRQFRDIRDYANQIGWEGYSSPGWLTFGYIFLSFISFELLMYESNLSNSIELLGLTILGLLIDITAVLLLVVVQKTLNGFWKKEQPELIMRSKFSRGEIVLLVIGGFLWFGNLIAIFNPE